jgi:hypothetical protein
MASRISEVAFGSLSSPRKKRQFRPIDSAEEYPVNSVNAGFTETMGLSVFDGSVTTIPKGQDSTADA